MFSLCSAVQWAELGGPNVFSESISFNQLLGLNKNLLFQKLSFSFPIQLLVNFMYGIIQMEIIHQTAAHVDVSCHVVTITFLSAGENRPITDVCAYSIIIFIFSFYTDCWHGCAIICQVPILAINLFKLSQV